VRVGGAKYNVRLESGIHNLASNISVGKSHDKSVFRRVVLVLVLQNQCFAGLIVRLALSSTSELYLETLVIGVVLYDLDVGHR